MKTSTFVSAIIGAGLLTKNNKLLNLIVENRKDIENVATVRSRTPAVITPVSIVSAILAKNNNSNASIEAQIKRHVSESACSAIGYNDDYKIFDWYKDKTDRIALAIIRGSRVIVYGKRGSGRKSAVIVGIRKAIESGMVPDLYVKNYSEGSNISEIDLIHDLFSRIYNIVSNMETVGRFSRVQDNIVNAINGRSIIITKDIDDIQVAIPDGKIETEMVEITEPQPDDMKEIVKIVYRNITAKEMDDDDAMEIALMSGKIKSSDSNPMKLISVIQKMVVNGKDVNTDNIKKEIKDITGISNIFVGMTMSGVSRVEKILRSNVIGQDEAVGEIIRTLRKRVIRDIKRPTSLLFAGKTGLGKSLCAKILAEALYGSDRYMIRINMNEFKEAHSVSQLIGSPPGYIGYNDKSVADKIAELGGVVLLLDEIEKAHKAVFDVLLQLLDEGIITSRKGNVADARKSIIIATTNIGTRMLSKKSIGFDGKKLTTNDKLKREIKDTMAPEMINRFDKIIVFKEFSKDDIRKIIDLEIGRAMSELNKHILSSIQNKTERIRDKVIKDVEENGNVDEYGAREIRRIVDRVIDDEIVSTILNK